MNPSGPVKTIFPNGDSIEVFKNPNPEKGRNITAEKVQEFHAERVARGYLMGTTHRSDKEAIRRKLEKKITKKIGAKGKLLTDNLFALVEGVYIVIQEEKDPKTGKTTGVKYYKEKPNLDAIKYAMDRVLGQPTKRQEVYDENEGLKTIESIVKTIANENHIENKPREGVIDVKPNDDVKKQGEQNRLTVTGEVS